MVKIEFIKQWPQVDSKYFCNTTEQRTLNQNIEVENRFTVERPFDHSFKFNRIHGSLVLYVSLVPPDSNCELPTDWQNILMIWMSTCVSCNLLKRLEIHSISLHCHCAAQPAPPGSDRPSPKWSAPPQIIHLLESVRKVADLIWSLEEEP